MAVKISRQPGKIVLIGAPTSAAALSPGHEKAPSALRAAGLAQALRDVGYDVTDFGDDPVFVPQEDNEHPRARNIPQVVAALEALRPRVELALKAGALPLILGGDCSIALAVVAAMRRYHKSVSAIYMDRDADLHTPATTLSGCVDGMVVSHLTGRGAAELVRPWGEPPLVREPDLALFGVARMDPAEEEFLRRSPIRQFPADQVQRAGPAAAARTALERVHAGTGDFLLHLDVDVISSDDFPATTYPAQGGLRLAEVAEALEVFVQDKNLGAFEVTLYNPDRDPQGEHARALIRLLVSVLEKRLTALKNSAKANIPAKPPIPAPPPEAAPEEPVQAAEIVFEAPTEQPAADFAAGTEDAAGEPPPEPEE